MAFQQTSCARTESKLTCARILRTVSFVSTSLAWASSKTDPSSCYNTHHHESQEKEIQKLARMPGSELHKGYGVQLGQAVNSTFFTLFLHCFLAVVRAWGRRHPLEEIAFKHGGKKHNFEEEENGNSHIPRTWKKWRQISSGFLCTFVSHNFLQCSPCLKCPCCAI